jgi:hypothetical protein
MSVKLHTGLSRGKASSAKEASMKKQASWRNTGIHHVELRATNPAALPTLFKLLFANNIFAAGRSGPDCAGRPYLGRKP